MFTYKSERKCLKQQTKKKRTCATSSSTDDAVDTGDTVRHAPGREQYMRLAKKAKKKV